MEVSFELGAAIVAGLIAGAIMEGPVYLQKALGLPVKQNIFRTWGQNLLRVPGAGGYVAGFFFHQAIAVFAAVLYALFFDLAGVEGNLWLWGLIGALIHLTIAGPVVAIIPSTDPETEVIGGQGLAYKNYGPLDVATSVVGHLGFGLSMAIFYGLLHTDGGS
ncbi:MAG: hypothetical protein KY458_14250, partial [Actinobacteria bacterium]|nr:hypothetical protein [Actinomycetota bacterium]